MALLLACKCLGIKRLYMNALCNLRQTKVGRGVGGYVLSPSPEAAWTHVPKSSSATRKTGLRSTAIRPEVPFNDGAGVAMPLLQGRQGLLRFLCIFALQVQRQRLLQLGLGAGRFSCSLERHTEVVAILRALRLLAYRVFSQRDRDPV